MSPDRARVMLGDDDPIELNRTKKILEIHGHKVVLDFQRVVNGLAETALTLPI